MITAKAVIRSEEAFRQVDDTIDALGPVEMGATLAGPVATYLKGRAENRFASEGNGTWDQLKTETQRIRVRLAAKHGWPIGAAHPINVRSGQMKDYITSGRSEVFVGAEDALMHYPDEPSTAMVPGSKSDLASKVQAAQMGNERTGPRPVLYLEDIDVGAITAIVGGAVLADT